MAVNMVPRSVLGPEKEWLTEAEVLGLLGIQSRTLDTYISEGRFPRGVVWGREAKWKWQDVAWFFLTKDICERFASPPVAAPEDLEDDEPPTRKRKQDATAAT